MHRYLSEDIHNHSVPASKDFSESKDQVIHGSSTYKEQIVSSGKYPGCVFLAWIKVIEVFK